MVSREIMSNIITGHGETILLADYDDMVLEALRDILERLNYVVLTASDGQEAVELYRVHQDAIDLLILDHALPRLGGKATLQEIHKINPEIRAIYISAFTPKPTGIEIISDPEIVLRKPFTIVELSQVVSHVLAD